MWSRFGPSFASTVAMTFLAWTSVQVQAQSNATEFDLPAQPLAESLRAVATSTRTNVLFDTLEIANRRAPALKGRVTIEEALSRLLVGSGLKAQYLDEKTIVLASVKQSSAGTSSGSPLATEMRLAQEGATDSSEPGGPGTTQANKDEISAAQSAGSPGIKIQEIVVTAQKREESLSEVPISIAVITNRDIERRGLIGMEDYLRSIPGVNQIDNGAMSNAIVIRGITTSPEFENFSSGTTVASYFDETPITAAAGQGAGGIDLRPVDIERIEVLRGPQGTAYGSSSLGGTMRMVPVKPYLDGFGVKLAAALGSTGEDGSENSMIQGIINVPLFSDRLAVRAVGYRYDESGFYRNIAGTDPATIALAESFGLGEVVQDHVEEDVGQMRSVGGRFAALWRATDNLDVSMNFLTQTIEQNGVPSETVGKYQQARFPVAPQGQIRGRAGEVQDTEIDLASIVLNYNMGWAGLTSTASSVSGGSAWASTANIEPFSATAPSDYRSFTAETRLASQLEGRFQFLIGLFYENVDDEFTYNLDWPGPPDTNPFGPDNPRVVTSNSKRELEQQAIFGELSYQLTKKVSATVGGRYFKYDKAQSDASEGLLAGPPVPPIDSSAEDWSLKASIDYQPADSALLYASWAQGFRLGRPQLPLSSAFCDANNDGVVDGTSIPIASTGVINSDFLDNYEIGAKLEFFERRFIVHASAYHIEWTGLPVRDYVTCNDPVLGPRVTAYTTNAGEATSKGVELQASVLALEGLRFDFGASYNKAELSQDVPDQGWFDGDRLPGSPEVSANLSAEYDFKIVGHKAFIRADSFYAGEFTGDIAATPGFEAGDYIKVDARAGMEIKDVSLELFVRNVTDEDAFTWRSTFGGYRMRPRTVGIQIGYSFE